MPYFWLAEAELLIILFTDNEETAGPLEPDETLKLEFLFVDAVSYEVIRLCSWIWDWWRSLSLSSINYIYYN